MRRGLLLPHVATEFGWDREEFLSHTALKAGLPADAWESPDVLVSCFTTDTFSETELLQPQ
jgi:AMMECR1 domain-containing protein